MKCNPLCIALLSLLLLPTLSPAAISEVESFVPIARGYQPQACASNGTDTDLVVGEWGSISVRKNGGAWSYLSTSPANVTDRYFDVAYADGRFVAVGSTTDPVTAAGVGLIATSTDTVTWTRQVFSTCDQIDSVTFGASSWVAVAHMRDGSTGSLTSTDGTNWTLHTISPNYFDLRVVRYLASRFIAGSSYGKIHTSSDGITWALATVPTDVPLVINALAADGNRVVAVGRGDNGSGGNYNDIRYSIVSTDGGLNWSAGSSGGRGAWESIAFAQGKFVASGSESPFSSNDSSASVSTSTDGISWTQLTQIPWSNYDRSSVRAVCSTSTGFLGVGYISGFGNPGDYRALLRIESTEGTAWTGGTIGAYEWTGVAHQGGNFYAVGSTQDSDAFNYVSTYPGAILRSADGKNWSLVKNTAKLLAITSSGSLLVAVGCTDLIGGGSRIYISSDGSTWTVPTSVGGDHLNAVAYGNGTFVAVGYQGDAGMGQQSCYITRTTTPAGTWSAAASGVIGQSDLKSVAYAVVNGTPTFIATGYHATTGAVFLRSTDDGLTWTEFDPGVSSVHKVAGYNGKFYLLGSTLRVSTDGGLNWTDELGTTSLGGNQAAFDTNEIYIAGSGNVRALDLVTYEETAFAFGGQIITYGGEDGLVFGSGGGLHHAITTPTVDLSGTFSFNENDATGAIFTLTRNGSRTSPLVVNYAIDSASTATSGSDFTALSGTATIPAGADTITIPVTIINDTEHEANEILTVNLLPGVGYVLGDSTASLSIFDEDAQTIWFETTTAQVTEGASVNLIARRNSILGSATADVDIGGGTASPFFDYFWDSSITFAPGSSTAEVSLSAITDSSAETNETVVLVLSEDSFSPTDASISSPSQATVTIKDFVLPTPPTVSISAPDATALEGTTNTGSFLVSRSGSTTSPLTVTYSVSGSATAPADFDTLSGQVEIAAGQVSANIEVSPNNDNHFEGSETVVVTLTTNAAYMLGTPSAATVTIADDDKPVINISATDATASEAGSAPGQFRITRTGSTSAPLTVTYSVSGSASAPTDYDTLSGQVQIAAGSVSANIVVSPNDDNHFEGSETVVVTLSSNSSYILGTPSAATVTIADDDKPVLTISATVATASEAGLASGQFRITRTGSTSAPLTVQYSVSGTASAPTDYDMLSGQVQIAAGSLSANIVVSPNDDKLFEGSETVVVTLASNAAYRIGTPSAATVTIADDDKPVLNISATDATASEAGLTPGQFQITRTGSTVPSVSVVLSVSGSAKNGTDYDAIKTTVTIPSGASKIVIAVTPKQDNAIEGQETVILTLAANAKYTVGSDSVAVVRVKDNDFPVVTVTASDQIASEEGDRGVFKIERTGPTTQSLTVGYTLPTGTGRATNGKDYKLLSGKVRIPAGASSTRVTVVPKKDKSTEGTESVVLKISGEEAYTVGSPSSASVKIKE